MLPADLLHLVAAFVPCRSTRVALGYSYDTCMRLGIPPCPLAVQPSLKAHLERLLPVRHQGWGLHVFYPERRISVWLSYQADDDSAQLLMTVTTCIGFVGPGRLRQALCGEIRDLHITCNDAAPGRWTVYRSTRSASFEALYGPEWQSAPWFEPYEYNTWFVRLDDTEEVVPLGAFCHPINQV